MCVYGCFACLYVSISCMCGTHGSHRKASNHWRYRQLWEPNPGPLQEHVISTVPRLNILMAVPAAYEGSILPTSLPSNVSSLGYRHSRGYKGAPHCGSVIFLVT